MLLDGNSKCRDLFSAFHHSVLKAAETQASRVEFHVRRLRRSLRGHSHSGADQETKSRACPLHHIEKRNSRGRDLFQYLEGVRIDLDGLELLHAHARLELETELGCEGNDFLFQIEQELDGDVKEVSLSCAAN